MKTKCAIQDTSKKILVAHNMTGDAPCLRQNGRCSVSRPTETWFAGLAKTARGGGCDGRKQNKEKGRKAHSKELPLNARQKMGKVLTSAAHASLQDNFSGFTLHFRSVFHIGRRQVLQFFSAVGEVELVGVAHL